MAGERNRLNKLETFKLTKWLDDEKPRISENNLSSSQVAEEATTTLGFQVNSRNILSIMGSSDEAIIPHSWPSAVGGGGEPPEGGHVNRRVAVLAHIVAHLVDGMPVPSNWRDMLGELVAQSRMPDSPEPSQKVEGDQPNQNQE